MKTDNIERYLNSFGKEVVRNAKKNLNSAGKGGGNLEKSIRFEVVTELVEPLRLEFNTTDSDIVVTKSAML